MKRITKIILILVVAAALLCAVPAAEAKSYRVRSMGVVLTVPDAWKYSSLNFSGGSYSNKYKLPQSSVTTKEENTVLGVTYGGVFKQAGSITMLRIGYASTDCEDTEEYFETVIKEDSLYRMNFYGRGQTETFGGKDYLVLDKMMARIYIHVENGNVYQYHFDLMLGETNQDEQVMESVQYLTEEEKESIDAYERSQIVTTEKPVAVSASSADKDKNSTGSSPAMVLYIMLLAGAVIAIVVIGKGKAERRKAEKSAAARAKEIVKSVLPVSKPAPKPAPVPAPAPAPKPAPKPAPVPAPKPKPKPKPLSMSEAVRESFETGDGYFKLGGSGFDAEPDGSGIAELALDVANGYPQLTWAYYEKDDLFGDILVTDAAPLPEELLPQLTPKILLTAVRHLAKLPDTAAVDFDALEKDKALALWCTIVQKRRSEFEYPSEQ